MSAPTYTPTATLAEIVQAHVRAYLGPEVDAVARFQGTLTDGLARRFNESFVWRRGAVMLRLTGVQSRGAGGLGAVSPAGTILVPAYGLEVYVVMPLKAKSDYDRTLAAFDAQNDRVRFELFYPDNVRSVNTATETLIHRFVRGDDAPLDEPGWLIQRHPFTLDVKRG